MMLDRFRIVQLHMEQDETIQKLSESVTVFRFVEGGWVDSLSSPVVDEILIGHLDRTRSEQAAWRPHNSKKSFFPVAEVDVVVEVIFPAPSNKPTRDQIQKRLSQCAIAGQNAYGASHDELTGLPNKGMFEAALRRHVANLAKAPSRVAAISEQQSSSMVHVVAIDIDHFKQINDTFGHLYGDLVLRCIAKRLANFANQQRSDVTFIASRQGGEEFACLLVGAVPREEAVKIAETIRTLVELEPMPSDGEWAALKASLLPQSSDIPHVSVRRVTISIGVASIRAPLSAEEITDEYVGLKERADIALYRAKAAGRNQVVDFSEVVSKFGRVLDHDQDMGIIAIDIGTRVGVGVGQEFIVYHPNYAGNTPYIFQDGRTHRRLGVYPRIDCGRIEVFDTQLEISFCKLVGEQSGRQKLIQGALLEAVPLGSISHLLSAEMRAALQVSPLPEADKASAESKADGKCAAVCVLTPANSESLVHSHGLGMVNRLLAELLSELKRQFANAAIRQVSPTQIAAILPAGAKIKSKDVENVMNLVEGKFGGLPRLSAGVIDDSDLQEFVAETKLQVDSAGAMDFALFALAEARARKNRIQRFSHYTPMYVINASRGAGIISRALEDYNALQKWNLIDANAENQMALIYTEQGDDKEAEAYIERALEKETTNAIFHLNAGLIKYDFENPYPLLDHFEVAKSLDSEIDIAPPYLPLYALSLYRAVELGNRALEKQEVIRVVRLAIENFEASGAPETVLKDLRSAIDELEVQ